MRAPQTVSAWTKDGLIILERLPGNRGITVRLPSLADEATGTEASVVSPPVTGSETSSEGGFGDRPGGTPSDGAADTILVLNRKAGGVTLYRYKP